MKIPQNIIDELIDQAKKDAPNESCGYLLGLPSSGEEGELLDGEYRPLVGAFLFRSERPVRCFAIRTEQRTEDPRQLAQSSGLALTTFARRPPTGQRSHNPLRHPLIT